MKNFLHPVVTGTDLNDLFALFVGRSIVQSGMCDSIYIYIYISHIYLKKNSETSIVDCPDHFQDACE